MDKKIETEIFEDTIEYIKTFLTYGDTELAKRIHYISEESVTEYASKVQGDIFIICSGFWKEEMYGSECSLPKSPLKKYRNVPILFGDTKESLLNGNIVIYADVIASTYFVLSRYEEYVQLECRDEYGNYPANESVLVKNDLLQTPIVDQYGGLLLEIFNELNQETRVLKKGIRKLYFTHDIDVPFQKYTFVNMMKTIGKSLLRYHRVTCVPFLNWLGIYVINPRNTWDYMLKKERQIKEYVSIDVESICFIVSIEKSDAYSMAYIRNKKGKKYVRDMLDAGAAIGLHTSYTGAESKEQMVAEKELLEKTMGQQVYYQRNHYLRQISPLDMERYEQAGFTDDFTTGFNEMPGFRLGTCRPVRWINPKTGRVHDIMLHGLHIMEGSLSGAKPYQMELSFEEAKQCCKDIIDKVYQYNGELCLLWHNGMFDKIPGNYQKELYDWIIAYSKKILNEDI